ncbi:putative leader peptide [Streptomyces sp. NPDC002680]|uniref:putative leader peptide n=1 Tax=Streptomyces sp. NPDC002680 TaxID=3364659 RepID=UPI00369495D3
MLLCQDPGFAGPEGRRRHVRHRAVEPASPRRPRLYSRRHIDLLRVAGALCCS